MGKRVLTIKMLREDLRYCTIGSFSIFLFLLIGIIPSCYLALTCIKNVFWLGIFYTVGVAFMCWFEITMLVNGMKLLAFLFRPPIVVVSTRVKSGSNKISLCTRLIHSRSQVDELIYFQGFGAVPALRYHENTYPGDKFYLLLTGNNQILTCYPCNDFEYEGELSPNKYER